jgi:DNA-binding PadR family transcriptional regulator
MTSSDTQPPGTARRSALGLVVLWQLYMEPMHVYRIQKLLEHQAKDRVVNVRSRASLYQTLERLMRLGLVEVHETVRLEGAPDRIVYAITDAGRETAAEWLREMLRETGSEFPEFIVAVSLLFGLPPDQAVDQLSQRADRLAEQLAETEQAIAASPEVPRLFLLEEEYRRTMLGAELGWVRGLLDDLRSGRLTWSHEWLMEVAERIGLPHDDERSTR